MSASALTDLGRHDRVSYRLSGPEALTPADRARILGQVFGRPARTFGQWARTHAAAFR